jgi:hypothetical protein
MCVTEDLDSSTHYYKAGSVAIGFLVPSIFLLLIAILWSGAKMILPSMMMIPEIIRLIVSFVALVAGILITLGWIIWLPTRDDSNLKPCKFLKNYC